MKYAPIFAFFCLLSFNLHAQSSPPPVEMVFGEDVPDYLRNAIVSGKVKVNGVQTLTAEVDTDPPRKVRQLNYGPWLRRYPESVIYLGQTVLGNPDVEDTCIQPPNVVRFLNGIRGAAFGDGRVTAEEVIVGGYPMK